MVLWIYFFGVRDVKTTIELPDELYRQAKALAALNGRKLKDLVEEGLRRVVESPSGPAGKRDLAALMKRARGMVDSGIPDLASSSRHLSGFGRDARHR